MLSGAPSHKRAEQGKEPSKNNSNRQGQAPKKGAPSSAKKASQQQRSNEDRARIIEAVDRAVESDSDDEEGVELQRTGEARRPSSSSSSSSSASIAAPSSEPSSRGRPPAGASISPSTCRKAFLVSALLTFVIVAMIAAFGRGFGNLFGKGGAAAGGAASAAAGAIDNAAANAASASAGDVKDAISGAIASITGSATPLPSSVPSSGSTPSSSSSPAASSSSASAAGPVGAGPFASTGISVFTRTPQVPTNWRIVRRYRHDKASFTQGLLWREVPPQPPSADGNPAPVISALAASDNTADALNGAHPSRNLLFESRGMWERSGVRKLVLNPPPASASSSSTDTSDAAKGSFQILKDAAMGPRDVFGEGICLWSPNYRDVLSRAASSAEAFATSTAAQHFSPILDDSSAYKRLGTDGDLLVQLTWTNRKGYVWGPRDLDKKATFDYTTTRNGERDNEGWGITNSGDEMFVSDGTSNIIAWKLKGWDASSGSSSSPIGYEADRVIPVRDVSRRAVRPTAYSAAIEAARQRQDAILPPTEQVSPPTGLNSDISRLNELEWAHGWLLSNIWFDNRVAIIDPGSGGAVAYLDLSPLKREQTNADAEVLNGIAYTLTLGPTSPAVDGVAQRPWGGRLWVTGKQWETLYELELGGFVTPDLGALTELRRRNLNDKEKKGGGASKKGKKGKKGKD